MGQMEVLQALAGSRWQSAPLALTVRQRSTA